MAYASVVVGTDGSATAEQAVRMAAELAGSAALVVVTAYPSAPGAEGADPPASDVRADAEAAAGRGRAVAEAAGASSVVAEAREGAPVEVLLRLAEEVRADLVVVGSLGMTGASRFTLGGVANDVTHRAGCDVLVVHTGA